MRARILFIGIMGLVFGVSCGWYFARLPAFVPVVAPAPAPSSSETTTPKTHVVLRHVNFTWEEVESDDYMTYIKNLRAIGCPEQTIRDIIVADVNQLYFHRRVTEVMSPDHQWWRSDPDSKLVEEASAKIKSLEAERIALLTRLLGPGWDVESSALPPARTAISLTGPILGDLSPSAKQAVYDIAVRTQKKIDSYLEAQRQLNKPADPMELARIRLESRASLAPILNPAQMEEFLLRYSQTATQLRGELRGLETTPDEFRKVFAARDALMSQAAYFYNGEDQGQIRLRDQLRAQVEAATKLAMGPEKYAAYQLNQDPVYRSSKQTVEQLGVPPAAVQPVYEINRLTQAELDRIRADETMSNEEKVEALAAAQVEQQKSLERILGSEAFQRWLTNKTQ